MGRPCLTPADLNTIRSCTAPVLCWNPNPPPPTSCIHTKALLFLFHNLFGLNLCTFHCSSPWQLLLQLSFTRRVDRHVIFAGARQTGLHFAGQFTRTYGCLVAWPLQCFCSLQTLHWEADCLDSTLFWPGKHHIFTGIYLHMCRIADDDVMSGICSAGT